MGGCPVLPAPGEGCGYRRQQKGQGATYAEKSAANGGKTQVQRIPQGLASTSSGTGILNSGNAIICPACDAAARGFFALSILPRWQGFEMRSTAILILFVALCFCAPLVGVALTRRAIPLWYSQLNKPSWTPPSWVFGPVWTALYLTMAVAAWLVWSRAGWDRGALALGLFALQLVLNTLWTPIFFGLKMPGVAFGEIVLLWSSILATAIAFWRITPTAGWLMVPYLGWTTFAAVLNLTIWRMNL